VQNEDSNVLERGKAGDEPAPDTATPERIIEAARRVLAKKGVAGLSVGNVSAEAGVYRAAIHYHFGDKRNLVARLVRDSYVDWAEQSLAAARSLPEGPQRIEFVLERWLDYVDSSADLLSYEVLGTTLRDNDLHEQLCQLYRWWEDTLVELWSGGEHPVDPHRLRSYARIARMFIDGATMDRLLFPDSTEWKIAARDLSRLLIEDLARPQDEKLNGENTGR
jgi:AcrR family transcriptional regulator